VLSSPFDSQGASSTTTSCPWGNQSRQGFNKQKARKDSKKEKLVLEQSMFY